LTFGLEGVLDKWKSENDQKSRQAQDHQPLIWSPDEESDWEEDLEPQLFWSRTKQRMVPLEELDPEHDRIEDPPKNLNTNMDSDPQPQPYSLNLDFKEEIQRTPNDTMSILDNLQLELHRQNQELVKGQHAMLELFQQLGEEGQRKLLHTTPFMEFIKQGPTMINWTTPSHPDLVQSTIDTPQELDSLVDKDSKDSLEHNLGSIENKHQEETEKVRGETLESESNRLKTSNPVGVAANVGDGEWSYNFKEIDYESVRIPITNLEEGREKEYDLEDEIDPTSNATPNSESDTKEVEENILEIKGLEGMSNETIVAEEMDSSLKRRLMLGCRAQYETLDFVTCPTRIKIPQPECTRIDTLSMDYNFMGTQAEYKTYIFSVWHVIFGVRSSTATCLHAHKLREDLTRACMIYLLQNSRPLGTGLHHNLIRICGLLILGLVNFEHTFLTQVIPVCAPPSWRR
jgi:hypothetical protein